MRPPRGLFMAVLLGTATVVSAQGPTLAERAAAIDHVLTEREGYRVVVGHISRELVIPVDTLRTQQAQTGLSWGELFVAHRIAREAKTSFDAVVADYRGGKSWETIARDHKADPGQVNAAVERSQIVMEKRGEDKPPPPITGTPSVVPPGGMPVIPGRY